MRCVMRRCTISKMTILKRISLLLLLTAVLGLMINHSLSTPWFNGDMSDHFDGETFFNIDNVSTDKQLIEIWQWQRNKPPSEWHWFEQRQVQPAVSRAERGHIYTQLINHATFLIQYDGLNVLTDPVYSKRVSPFSFVGPARWRNPAIAFDDLPDIDVVIISHNHYDHLDLDTLKRLKQAHDPLFIVPLGNSPLLEDVGISKIQELDWWQATRLAGGQVIHAVPAQHWSSRSATDRRRALWSGFVLETDAGNVVFAGDTGYARHFKLIAERFPKPRLALLPIGAYAPRWFMADQHMDPAQALQAHQDLGAQYSLGMHFGTFELTSEPPQEPSELLADLAAEKAITSFDSPVHGQVYHFAAK